MRWVEDQNGRGFSLLSTEGRMIGRIDIRGANLEAGAVKSGSGNNYRDYTAQLKKDAETLNLMNLISAPDFDGVVYPDGAAAINAGCYKHLEKAMAAVEGWWDSWNERG